MTTRPRQFPVRVRAALRARESPVPDNPETTAIEVDGARLSAEFGPWRIDTPHGNIRRSVDHRPYTFLKTAGPPLSDSLTTV